WRLAPRESAFASAEATMESLAPSPCYCFQEPHVASALIVFRRTRKTYAHELLPLRGQGGVGLKTASHVALTRTDGAGVSGAVDPRCRHRRLADACPDGARAAGPQVAGEADR